MSEKCTLTPDSLDQLENMLKGDSVLFFHSHSCPHCKKAVPVIEDICMQNESPTKVINCPIEKIWCRKKAQEAKVSGVPVVMGVSNGNVKKPKWKVVGAKLDDIRKNMISELSGGKPSKKKGRSHQPPPQQAQQQMHAQPRAPTLDAIAVQLLGSGAPTQPNLGMSHFEAPKKVELCVPGKHCTRDEFHQRFVDFYQEWSR